MEYRIDLHEINGLKRWYGKQPRRMQVACAQMLNHFAFGTRSKAIKQIGKTMTVRSPGFVRKQMWAIKTSGSLPVSAQRSYAGSKATDRFTAWAEQERGVKMVRHRLGTLLSRGGSNQRRMLPSSRLKPGSTVAKIEEFNPKGGTSNFGGFIAMMMRKKEKRLIKIKGSFYKLPKGIGKPLQGPTLPGAALFKRLQLIQRPTKKQPKQIHWLRQARAIYFKTTNVDALWEKTATALMGKPGKK